MAGGGLTRIAIASKQALLPALHRRAPVGMPLAAMNAHPVKVAHGRAVGPKEVMMRRKWTPGAKALAVALVLVLGPGLAAAPAFAADAAPVPVKPTTLAAAVEAKLATMDTAAAVVQAPAAPAAAGTSGRSSFFKTPKGAAALILLGGLTGYSIYGALNKAATSPGRK